MIIFIALTILRFRETVTDHNPDYFFPFLQEVATHDAFEDWHKTVPSELYHLVLDLAIHHGYLSDIGSNTVAATKMNLGLHTATPKIEAFYQYYQDRHAFREGTDCGSWIDWYGQVVCDVETLAHLAGVETLDPAGGLSGNM